MKSASLIKSTNFRSQAIRRRDRTFGKKIFYCLQVKKMKKKIKVVDRPIAQENEIIL